MSAFAVRKEPCRSCPYRQDCPSGVWDAAEYDKLPRYDNGHPEQQYGGVFLCHQPAERGEAVCRGWLSVHREDVAVRLALMNESVTRDDADAEVKTPLFASGAEAAAHGMREVKRPSVEAQLMGRRIERKREKEAAR